MRLLVGLRLLEAVGRVGEISAAILQVVVEEELVELVAEVVVMGDVAPRAGRPVAAPQRLDSARSCPCRAACGRWPPSSQRLAPTTSSSRSRMAAVLDRSAGRPYRPRRCPAAGCGRGRAAPCGRRSGRSAPRRRRGRRSARLPSASMTVSVPRLTTVAEQLADQCHVRSPTAHDAARLRFRSARSSTGRRRRRCRGRAACAPGPRCRLRRRCWRTPGCARGPSIRRPRRATG